MAAVRVSFTELKAETEKLYTILEKSCQSGTNFSSTIDYMRAKYDRILRSWLTNRQSKDIHHEDVKSAKIIEDQQLKSFIPEDTKPAR